MQANPNRQEGGTSEQALQAYWRGVVDQRLSCAKARCIELAAGSGAVSGLVLEAAPSVELVCTDISPSALGLARAAQPAVMPVACNANLPPFLPRSFDFVFSQFGVEYAGRAALTAAAELVAAGGCLALVLHMKGGAIYGTYETNLAAVEALRDSQVLPLAQAAFTAGFDLNEGRIEPAVFKAAERAFQPAVRAVEALFRSHGEAVADGLPQQLYRDIAHIYPRMSSYQRSDIMLWLDGMAQEIDAYRDRLLSMLGSALDEAAVSAFVAACESAGFTTRRREKLQLGGVQASGWVLELLRAPA